MFIFSVLISLFVLLSSQLFAIKASDRNQNLYLKAPNFTQLPPRNSLTSHQIEYYNTNGVVLVCKADGYPKPAIRWIKASTGFTFGEPSAVDEIRNVRHIREDGSLVILPFSTDQFRQDVHSSTYRCLAANKLGTIVSPDIKLLGVIKQEYKIQSSDEFVVLGNSGSLPCTIPSSVRDFVAITHWQRNDGIVIDNNLVSAASIHDNVHLLSDGSLFFSKIVSDYSRWKYRCVAVDRLSGETLSSNTWSRLIITDANSKSSPRILTPYREYITKTGKSVRIGCVAQASPVPSYHWFKEDTSSSLHSYRSFEAMLRIDSLKTKDSGSYVCIANNSLGHDRQKFKVTVKDPLSIALRPEKGLQAKEGETIVIECYTRNEIEFYPRLLSFEWLKDGKPLTFGSRIRLISRNKLRIASIAREDRGMYQCVAKDAGDKETAIAYTLLSIQEKAPEFQYKFKSHSLDSGAHLSLRCSAYGSPLPQIHWYFFDRLLNKPKYRNRFRIGDYVDGNGIIISYVNITAVSSEDGGLYSCQAFNDIATITHSANVNVYGPPFVHQMDNLTVVTATKVQLDCPASGFPLNVIYWRKDGKEFLPSRRLKSYRNGTLSIIDAHLDDEGWYECIAKAKDNKIASASLYIDIVEKPVINPFMFGSDLREGMRTTVVCSVLSGESPISVNWFKNGELVKHIHPEVEILSLGEFTSTLRFASVQRNHSGNYTCKASSANVSSNFTAMMVVQAFPKWILKPNSVYSVLKGRSIVIECQAEGFPAPIHHWKLLKESNGLTSADYITIVSGPHIHVLENGSLAIIDSTKSDEGDYVCETNNGIGATITAALKLRVNIPVHFDKNFEVIKVQKGQRAVLKCEAMGDPPILVSWAKDREAFGAFDAKSSKYVLNEQMTPEGLSSQITIDFVEVSDSAFFTCAASNPFGKDEKNIQLLVQGPPEAPRNLKINEVQSRQITLSWLESSNGNSPLLTYLIQYTRSNGSWNHGFDTSSVPSKDLTHSITGLAPSVEYKIRVVAENLFGKSLPSEEITIKTAEEAPSLIPSNVKVESINSRTLKVHWKHFKEAANVDGYYIGYREIETFSSTKNAFSFKTMELLESSSETQDLHFLLTDLKRNTKYSVVVRAFNEIGAGSASEEVVTQTLQFDAPSPVNIKVFASSTHSLTVTWDSDDDENPVNGYIVNYGTSQDNWEEQKIIGHRKSIVIPNLLCGNKYQVSLTPFNSVGRSEASEPMTVSTLGSVASAPTLESLLEINSSFVVIRLSSWSDNSCPIISFVIQYKEHYLRDWIMLSNNVIPEQSKVVISDLIPATFYDLLMTANSEAGTTEAQYLFSTLTTSGATIAPLTASRDSNWELSLSDPLIFAPLLCAFIAFFIIFATITFLVTSRQQRAEHSQETYGSDGNRKMESLSMSSLTLGQHSSNEGKKLYESSGHPEPGYSSFYTSPYVANRISFRGDREDMLRKQNIGVQRHSMSECDHPYDVPLNQETLRQEYKLNIEYQTLLNAQNAANCGEEVVNVFQEKYLL